MKHRRIGDPPHRVEFLDRVKKKIDDRRSSKVRLARDKSEGVEVKYHQINSKQSGQERGLQGAT